MDKIFHQQPVNEDIAPTDVAQEDEVGAIVEEGRVSSMGMGDNCFGRGASEGCYVA